MTSSFFFSFFSLIFAALQSTCITRRWFRCKCHNLKPAILLFFCSLLTNACHLLTPVHCHANAKLCSKDELQLVGWLMTFIVRIPPVIRLASKTPVSETYKKSPPSKTITQTATDDELWTLYWSFVCVQHWQTKAWSSCHDPDLTSKWPTSFNGHASFILHANGAEMPQMHRSECRKLFAMPSISQPGWPHSVSVIRDSSPAHRHPNEPWHWLQAFLQTENAGPSNSISTLRLSSPDYKAGCGCCPTGTWLIFHAPHYLLQTIRPLRLVLLMWKMWGCFIYEKEWRRPIKQVADAAIKDIWRLWWRFESCIRELFNKKKTWVGPG